MKPRKNLFVNKYKRPDGLFYFGTSTFFNEADACNAGRDSENWICAVEFLQKETEQPQHDLSMNTEGVVKIGGTLQEPEPQSQELKTMLIADAIKQGLIKGNRIWVELEVESFDDGDNTIKLANASNNSAIYAKTNSTLCIYTPQPFTPKHNEKCRIETKYCNKRECIATIMPDGNIYAFVDFDGKITIYHPEEIKQFLPLE